MACVFAVFQRPSSLCLPFVSPDLAAFVQLVDSMVWVSSQ